MMKFSGVSIIGLLAIILCVPVSDASAQQNWGRRLAGPEPGDNQANALATGRQLVGVGGQCLNVDRSGTATMRPCDPNARTQRFKFEDGRLKTAAVIVVNGFNMMDEAWMNGCFSLGSGRNVQLFVGYCRQSGVAYAERQVWNMRVSWQPNVMEIMGVAGYCIDVSAGRTDPGAPVVAWGCSGGSGQRWVWR